MKGKVSLCPMKNKELIFVVYMHRKPAVKTYPQQVRSCQEQ